MTYIRQDQADIHFTLDGIAYGDSWFSVEGGALTAETTKTRPGGMGKQVDIGGPAERGDVTLKIQMSDVVLSWHKTFEKRMGIGRGKAAYKFLGPERTPYGITHSVVGTLKGAALPDMGDGSETAMYTVVIGLDQDAV